MESNKPNAQDRGKVIVIDPNKGGPPIQEDLFIYVKLKAYTKSRSVIINESGRDGSSVESDDDPNGTEVNFIATKLDENSPDKISYATTDYTEIGGLNLENNKSGTLEGFGINSINITYNSSLIPQVDISFTDLRGSSLFDVIDKDNRKSPYSLFFKMPYPTFQLTVKGYYGRPVTYCLHMLKWSSSFNSDSGNFDITAKFVGYQGAFLSDIKIQNIIGVTNTDSGKEKLKNLKVTSKNGESIGTPKLSDFLNEIARLEVDLAEIKASSKGTEELKKLTTSKLLINNILTLVGSPIKQDGTNKGNDSESEKNIDQFFGGGIKSPNFTTNTNIIVIRDVIIIKKSDQNYFDVFAETANKVYKEYSNYIEDIADNNDYKINDYNFSELNKDGGVKYNNIGEFKFSAFTEDLYTTNSDTYKAVKADSKFDPNKDDIYDSASKLNEKYNKKGKEDFSPNTEVIVYDFTKMRDNLIGIQSKLKDIIESKKKKLIKEINNELNKKLVIEPKIKNIFQILMNNTQVMLEEIYSVSRDAETYKNERFIQLRKNTTDNPSTNKQVYAWPDVYEVSDNGDSKRVWLGDIDGIDSSFFPEIEFVDNVIDAYTKTATEMKEIRELVKDIQNSRSADNWMPINTLDYENNPYDEYAGSVPWNDTIDDVPKKLYSTIIKRAITLYSYTNIKNTNKFNAYSYIEGATAANNIMLSEKYKDVIKQNFNVETALSYAVATGVTTNSGNDYILKDTKLNSKFDIGEKQPKIIVGDTISNITNNRNGIDKDIKEIYKDKFESITEIKNNDVSKGILYMDSNYLYRHNISYLVWPENTRNNINLPTTYDSAYDLKFDKISDIKGLSKSVTTSTNNPEGLIKEILNNINFIDFNTIKKKYIENVTSQEQKVAKVLELPELYIVWVGSKIEGNPDIDTTDYLLQKYYDKWYKSNGKKFINLHREYITNPEDEKNNSNLLAKLQKTDFMVVNTPNISNDVIKIEKSKLKTFLNGFKAGYDKFSQDIDIKESKEYQKSQSEIIRNKDLKISIYNYFKEIFDKWIGGTEDGKVFNVCSGGGDGKENLIDYFRFINRAWVDIGDDAACNLSSLITLAPDTKLNLYLYISKILRDSNFLLQILPSYINFKHVDEVNDMFTPITDFSKRYNTGPTYVCILAGGQSKALAIDDNGRYDYNDDSLSIDKLASEAGGDIKEGEAITDRLVAFKVAFGSDRQSIFKDISLNQDEHSATGEYFKQLSNLVDKRGKTQSILQGNDLYDLFSVRSYKCKVGGLGNMNIQPLMYFDLQNVPFYRGAYLITSVEHSITPNHMETSFTGLRQSQFTVPVVTDTTTFMNIDFNEVDEIAQRLSVKSLLNDQNVINIDTAITSPTETFDLDKLSPNGLSNLLNSSDTIYMERLSSKMNNWLNAFGVVNNSEVCNFLSQCMWESRNFKTPIEIWGKGDGTGSQQKYEPETKKAKELGNTAEGDGKRFRGRGFIQITGKVNYKLLEENTTKGKDGVIANSLFKGITEKDNYEDIDSLFDVNTVEGTERSLVASLIWWQKNIDRKTLVNGDIATVTLVTKKVNGGYSHLEERINKFELCVDQFNLKGSYGVINKPIEINVPTL